MFTKANLKSALVSILVLAAVKNFAPLSVKKYL
jgi:hypothetical protein